MPKILIVLSDCLRDDFLKKEKSSENIEEWNDYKTFLTPIDNTESIINELYDCDYKISIVCEEKIFDKEWLKEHFIPFDNITNNINEKCDIFISSNMDECLLVKKNNSFCKVFLFTGNRFWENKEYPKHDGISVFNNWMNIEWNKL